MSRTRSRAGRLAIAAAIVLGMTGLAGVANGDLAQVGNVVIQFQGAITPQSLPQTHLAPIGVHIEGGLKTTDGSVPPQLKEISVALNGHGVLSENGLPNCPFRRIRATSLEDAERACADSLVGHGQVTVELVIPEQQPFVIHTRLLAFKGKIGHGRTGIIAQLHSDDFPVVIALPFEVQHVPGTFGTIFTAKLPSSARIIYITRFEMTLQRKYMYKGKVRSYLSGGCPAPKGFPGAIFPFARASFAFNDGRSRTMTIVRHCTVRDRPRR